MSLITGTTGNDILIGGDEDDVISGLEGNDSLSGGGGNDSLVGGAGADTLDGGSGADTMVGGEGLDRYFVDDAGDLVIEPDGFDPFHVDHVTSSLAAYTLPANVENGAIASSGAANLTGNELDNVLAAGSGDNVIDGRAGRNTVIYGVIPEGVTIDLGLSTPQATGGSGMDTLLNIDNLLGTPFADRFIGNAADNQLRTTGGNDTLEGRDGNDVLSGGADDDLIDGGAGSDWADYSDSGSTAGVVVSLAITTAQNTEGAGTDTLLSIENLVGSRYGDRLTGNDEDNILRGYPGSDTLTGGAGADRFVLELDYFNVIFPATTFYFDLNPNLDVITDFVPGEDKLLFHNLNLAALSYIGTLAPGNFRSGAGVVTAADADDFLLYDTDTGNLYYDADGNGTAAPVHLAILSGAPALQASDFEVGGILSGTAGADTLYGGVMQDQLEGLDGSDWLDGGAGSDTMIGGDGNDTYVVRDSWDLVIETNSDRATGGSDHVDSYLTAYTLPDNVENGNISIAESANLTGNSLNNVLGAGPGDNVIDGGEGIDVVVYSGAAATAGVHVNLATSGPQDTGGSGFDTLIGIEQVFGTNWADTLTGNDAANFLFGGDGDDTLNGGAGNDLLFGAGGNNTLDGGTGLDTAWFSGRHQNYTIVMGTTTTVGADTLTGVERLRFQDTMLALDVDGDAGTVAKILGAVFGKTTVADKNFVGIGLYFKDSGFDSEALVQMAIDAKLGAGASNRQVVDLVYTNIVGENPSEETAQFYVAMLEDGTHSVGSLGLMAADTALNAANIDLTGLLQHGILYTEYLG